jgi:membrane protein YqaA with SNARE-associated domain
VSAVLLAVAYGAASALVPVVNAELYAVAAAGRSHPTTAVALVVALALGQTAGKLVLFEAARRGSARFTRKRPSRAWARRISDALRSRRTAVPLVLTAAGLGVPPLAAVSLAAGAAGQRRWEFGALCLLGRVARFGVLALPVAFALG